MNATNSVKTERMTRMGLPSEPAGYVEGTNLYEYVGSSPTNEIDPLGLQGATTQQTTTPPAVPVPAPDKTLPKMGPGQVTNNSSVTVYYPVSGQGWFPLPPGGVTPSVNDVDGVALPIGMAPIDPKTGLPTVTKIVDGMQAIVKADGTVQVAVMPGHSPAGAVICVAGQVKNGGQVLPTALQPAPPPGWPGGPPATTAPTAPPPTQPTQP
jgi:hypothetical protein